MSAGFPAFKQWYACEWLEITAGQELLCLTKSQWGVAPICWAVGKHGPQTGSPSEISDSSPAHQTENEKRRDNWAVGPATLLPAHTHK